MKISIIGTGYVGLVTGVCLSDFNTVYCIDNDKAKINMLNKGTIPIYEPGLNHIMQKNVKNKRLFFTSDLSSTIQKTDILIIAVGTPQNEKGAADLSNVFKVIKIIAASINNYKLIVIKSTVPVGTCKKIESIIRKSADKNGLYIISIIFFAFELCPILFIPTIILSGFLKSFIAFPSLKNSGFEITSNCAFLSADFLIIDSIFLHVPTGTVLFMTINL